MVRAVQRLGGPSVISLHCFSTLITACVPARLPELSRTITRSPGRSNTVILQNLAKLSTPAFVRESDARTIPSLSKMPIQYVIRCLSRLAELDFDCGRALQLHPPALSMGRTQPNTRSANCVND